MTQMFKFDQIKRSFFISLWFVFLTFPIMVIKVDSIEKTVEWRWMNMIYVAVGSFLLSFVFRYMISKREMKTSEDEKQKDKTGQSILHQWLTIPKYRNIIYI